MTKGSPHPLNASSHKLSSPRSTHQTHHHPVRSPSDRRLLGDKSSSPSPERHRKRQTSPPPANTPTAVEASNGHEDDSEAETEILSDEEQTQDRIKRSSVKKEPKEEADASSLLSKARSEPAHSNAPSRASSVRREISNKNDTKSNGAKDRENGKAKEERKEKAGLSVDVGKNGSRAQSADASTFPHLDDERSRQAQSAEPRKRKFTDAQKSSRFEPPRQKPRLDETSDPARPRKRRPSSPPTPGTPALRSAHRRSASTQSALQSAGLNSARKRRDLASSQAASGSGQKDWPSDMSSDEAAGYPPVPKLAPPPRSGRAAYRATTSPARAAPMGKRADRFGSTPLARACEKGNFQAVRQAYEEAPAEIDQADNGGFAPLQKAALEGYADIVQFLLEKGCRTDCASKDDHDTPLIDAVENGHKDVVKLLLDHGVNPHHQNKSGKRAIDAIDDEDEFASDLRDMLQTAMQNYVGSESDSDDDESSEKLIIRPEDRNRTDLLYLEPNRRNLLEYSTKGDVVAVDHFLSSVKPDNACAVVAARGGHHLVLNLLLASAGGQLETDPDPLEYEETPLLAAIGRGLKGHLKIIKLLLQQDHFNPTRKTKDGKYYWEVAEERRGPRWHTERDLLKEYYDAYLAKRKVTKKRKLVADGITKGNHEKKMDGMGVAEPLSSPQSAKEKKRHLKPSSQLTDGKEGKRRHRPLLESSDEDDVDEEVRAPKKKRKRQDSSASKSSRVGPPSPVLSRHSSGSKLSNREDTKGVHGGPKMQRNISSEKPHSTKSPASARSSSKASTPEPTREARKAEDEARAAKAAQKAAEVERKKREAEEAAAAAAAVEAERKAREAEEERLRKEREALERRQVEERERERERREREELERKQKEERERKQKEERERREREERERKEREERERKEREEREQKEREVREQKEREEREQKEREENERRIASLPLALRLAVRDSRDRPLMFACATPEHREKYGIGMQFLPLFTAPLQDIDSTSDATRQAELWIMNFQVVGILGLPSELRLAEFPDWERRPVTDEQRRYFLERYDISKLAQDYKWPQPGDRGHDAWANLRRLEETRQAFFSMEPLHWVKLSDFEAALSRPEYGHLRKLKMRTKPARIKEPEDLPPPDFWTEADADPPAPSSDVLDKADSVAEVVVEDQKTA